MRATFAILAAVVMSTMAISAPPTLKLPDEVSVPLYSFGRLKAEGEFEFISWKLPKGLKVERVGDREFLFTGPAGSYTFEAVASSKEGITTFERSQIVIGDGKVTPTPDDHKQPPPPIPPDPPGPVKGKVAWVVVIEETSQRTPEVAKVLADVAAWNALGVKWRFYDQDDAYAKIAGYKRTADKANVALPALLLISDKGDPITAVPLPKTVADIKAKIEEVSK